MQLSFFKTCTHCNQKKFLTEFHAQKRGLFGREAKCKRCKSDYYFENKKRHNEKAKQYYDNHKEQTRERIANNKAAKPDLYKDIVKKWRERNADKVRSYTKKWRDAHPEQSKENNRQWRKDHPEFDRTKGQNRWARKRGSAKRITLSEWNAILVANEFKCFYCGSLENITQDHWLPLSKGGEHTASNIVPACRSCNSKKGVMTGDEYLNRNK